jgi:hypothetical protein
MTYEFIELAVATEMNVKPILSETKSRRIEINLQTEL